MIAIALVLEGWTREAAAEAGAAASQLDRRRLSAEQAGHGGGMGRGSSRVRKGG